MRILDLAYILALGAGLGLGSAHWAVAGRSAVGRVEVGASVHFDMQTWSDLQPGDRIVVQRAPYTIRFVHPEGYSFFSTLRRKLHWNLMPQATDNVE